MPNALYVVICTRIMFKGPTVERESTYCVWITCKSPTLSDGSTAPGQWYSKEEPAGWDSFGRSYSRIMVVEWDCPLMDVLYNPRGWSGIRVWLKGMRTAQLR